MSKYSSEIDGIIDSGVDKVVKEIGDRLLDYGKFTYDADTVRQYKNKLTYFTTLENFLSEYVDGEEEVAEEDLLTIARISNSSVRLGGSTSGTSSTVPSAATSVNNTIFKVNGEPVGGVYLGRINEVITLEAEYTGDGNVQLIHMELDGGVSATEEADQVYLSNYKLAYDGSLIKEVTITITVEGLVDPLVTVFAIVIVDYDETVPVGFDYTYPVILS